MRVRSIKRILCGTTKVPTEVTNVAGIMLRSGVDGRRGVGAGGAVGGHFARVTVAHNVELIIVGAAVHLYRGMRAVFEFRRGRVFLLCSIEILNVDVDVSCMLLGKR